MNCGLIVLWVSIIAVRGKKCDNRGNVMMSVSCNPFFAANNDLIELSLTRNIRIEGVNGRNGINGESGTIWSHVGKKNCTLN